MAEAPIAREDYRLLTGMQKSAILLMAVDEANATKIFSIMEDDEIKDMSNAMSSLGSISADTMERLFLEFVERMAASGVVMGTYESTEKLLLKALGKDRVDSIMEDIRGPAGRTTWDKLGNVNEEVLANFLKNEYPQTIALVLTKLTAAHAARVLSVLNDDLAMEVIMRMISMDSVKKEVLEGIEKTLRVEFMNNLTKIQRRDTHEVMAEIFNNFDRNNEAKFMSKLEEQAADVAEHVRSLMFTFEDLSKLDTAGIQTLLRVIDKDKLGTALKGASATIKTLFFINMSERASKILNEDMESMGPVRLKDVDEAQMYIVTTAKNLAAKGDIVIADASGEDQMVY